MTRQTRTLLEHRVQRLVLEHLLLVGSGTLAFAAIAMGRVKVSETPSLMDGRLLTLFFVLTIAVELGKASDLFDRVVETVARRVHSARGLAAAMIATTGLLATLLTNDVALVLVVPFTMLFRKVMDAPLAPIVVLEVAAANLIGALSPLGNPQNLYLFTRGHLTLSGFLADQVPWVAGASALLLLAVPLVVPRRRLGAAPGRVYDVDPLIAAAFVAVLGTEVAALAGVAHHWIPLAFALLGAVLLGRRLRDADFSLVFIFAFLFVGIAGLERGRLYESIDPAVLFGHQTHGLVLSGAIVSQFVSNVPAAMLLAPTVHSPEGLRALIHGLNAGGCGTPIASLANLIGAQLFVREGGAPRAFWRAFLPLNAALLVLLVAVSLALVSL
ncbi:MAG TPA: SLC13 family permease [Thermoanaerobaculia bacterium]|nr:SLC13 family permease [Thermoanaerobaculia bacterium]